MWSNQGGNGAPTTNQNAAYRLYGYDGAGFPTTIERGAGGTHATDALYWDGVGNLRRLFTPGAVNQDYTAEYDGDGDRVSATFNGVQHVYSGDLFDEVGNTLFTPGVSQNSGGQDRFFHEDHLGSTRYLTDTAGTTQGLFRYDAFGSPSAIAGTSGTKYGFGGQWGYQNDAPQGLHLLGLRYYDPPMGRFLRPDPIGFAGGLNFYAYCDADPVNAVDPSGLVTWRDVGNGVANGGKAVLRGIQWGVTKLGERIWNGLKPLWTPRGSLSHVGLRNAYVDHPFDDDPEIYASSRALRTGGRQISAFIDREGNEICGTIALASISALAEARVGCNASRALPSFNGYNPWEGQIYSGVLEKDVVLYRVWGGNAPRLGGWLTPIRLGSSSVARSILALPSGNLAVTISEVVVPPGTHMQYGKAAPAFGQLGGGPQVLLLDRIPSGNFGPGAPLHP